MPIKYSYCFTAASVGSLLLSDLILGCLYHPFTLIGALALECLFVGSRAGFTMRPRSIKASLAPACSFVAVLFCSVLFCVLLGVPWSWTTLSFVSMGCVAPKGFLRSVCMPWHELLWCAFTARPFTESPVRMSVSSHAIDSAASALNKCRRVHL